jgi:hypothetical protein
MSWACSFDGGNLEMYTEYWWKILKNSHLEDRKRWDYIKRHLKETLCRCELKGLQIMSFGISSAEPLTFVTKEFV